MTNLNAILRRRAALVLAVAMTVAALGVPGSGPQAAWAEEECDAECWAILAYLTEQGLTPEEIEDLDDSGIPPDRPAPPVTTTTLPPTTLPPTTTTAPAPRPTTTTTAPTWRPTPATTTTTVPPPATEDEVCGTPGTWACDEVTAGRDEGYLPGGFDPHDEADPEQVRQIIEDFGEQNPHFDAQAALAALQDMGDETERGEMFNAIAAGLGIPYDPDGDGSELADELGELGIVFGHDGDPTNNPVDDADPTSVLFNDQLAALLDRVEDVTVPGGGDTGVVSPGGGNSATPCASSQHRHSSGGSCHAHPDPGCTPSGTYSAVNGSGHKTVATGVCAPPADDEACASGLALTASERTRFAEQLRWQTLVRIEAHGEPGVRWPPHPDVPGGDEFLVVSRSPVWPVLDSGAQWEVTDDSDGCVWVASSLETQVWQMLPWSTGHRRMLEAAGTFGVYLNRWDGLNPGRQAQAIQRHQNGDVNMTCPLATATVSQDAYDQCRWKLSESGVWRWQARACFEASAGDAVYRECEVLAEGVEWFLGIGDYTSGITVQAGAGLGPRHMARAR